MRFTTSRLCGGDSFMAISAEPMDIDMAKAAESISARGCPISKVGELELTFTWNGMEVTLYPSGKIMFFPLKDRALCIKYATELLESL
ncbi:MAG: hypothetical protein IKP20_04320 [Candidatus Methanomethylophilaceae archaeon]|nr:hypothetical protein [Candidatus Methanomethylophilaceae archaeon]